MKKIPSFILLATLTTSCATTLESTLLGVGVGGAIGGGLGTAAGQAKGRPASGATIGAAVGAALGGLAGFLKHRENFAKQKMTLDSPNAGDSNFQPSMTLPKVRRVWVPDAIEDNKLVRGHFVYILEESSRWRLDDDSRK